MKVRDIQVRAVVAPLEPPVRTASGHVTQAPMLLIDLATDSGVIGRSYLFGYQAFTLAPLRELVRALGEMIKGAEVAGGDRQEANRFMGAPSGASRRTCGSKGIAGCGAVGRKTSSRTPAAT